MVRDYAVRIFGAVDESVRQRLLTGVDLDDGRAAFESIQPLDRGEQANTWYRVRLREGKNRLVRRLWESQGVQISRLIRVQYGPYEMPPRLREGQVHAFTAGEVRDLAQRVGLADGADGAGRSRS
jgi:23S rRNA pseudouridine2605 synthase